MASFGSTKNGGADVATRFGGYGVATAGSTGDATLVNGPWIDRRDFSWAKVSVALRAVLGATNTLSVLGQMQDADNAAGLNAANFGDAVANAVDLTGQSGGSTETGVIEADYDLTMARGWIRFNFTPDLNRANTDTSTAMVMFTLGGGHFHPKTASLEPSYS